MLLQLFGTYWDMSTTFATSSFDLFGFNITFNTLYWFFMRASFEGRKNQYILAGKEYALYDPVVRVCKIHLDLLCCK